MHRFLQLLLTILLAVGHLGVAPASADALEGGDDTAAGGLDPAAERAMPVEHGEEPTGLVAADRTGVQEWGLLSGYGPSERDDIFLVPLFGRAAWFLPDFVDEPLHEYDLNLRWVVEGWIAGVFDAPGDAFEVGISPIVLKLDYDAGQRFVPFGIGGVGAMYTGLQGQDLGGPFEFASFVGVGLHTFLNDNVALTLSWRIRHISNAGIKEPNKGLNTNFFLIGLEFFPKR